ncbi:glutathione S-transferase class-mu 28 kDa isozyme-like [Mercenaria mercenaria]|uniref:glutathione S-transferase class-mu 28 kDa isozyme-like n=1 Tax=Mercenaria mercenaria TaxID=6596 RepID=UPI00234F625B|nr:glutathione S-transferase class-mu 28 kDa isozyme-like [Mercenaria mercenaria]
MANVTYKVSYFPAKGGAEIIRLVLVAGGKEFEDERLTRDEWLKVKQDTPTKQMPLLTVTENGKKKVYGQSGACTRYLARKLGLFGKSPEEELLVDEAYECVVDVQKEVFKIFMEQDETKKAELVKNIKADDLKRLNDYIKLRAGERKYIIGDSMTLADLQLYNVVDQSASVVKDLFSSFTEIQKHADVVKSNPKIAEWAKKSQQTKQ